MLLECKCRIKVTLVLSESGYKQVILLGHNIKSSDSVICVITCTTEAYFLSTMWMIVFLPMKCDLTDKVEYVSQTHFLKGIGKY